MFQRVCDKCGKIIKQKDKYIELSSEAWQDGGTIWNDKMWLMNTHLCENCAQELIEWLGEKK